MELSGNTYINACRHVKGGDIGEIFVYYYCYYYYYIGCRVDVDVGKIGLPIVRRVNTAVARSGGLARLPCRTYYK
jgi:hypothetical protein